MSEINYYPPFIMKIGTTRSIKIKFLLKYYDFAKFVIITAYTYKIQLN